MLINKKTTPAYSLAVATCSEIMFWPISPQWERLIYTLLSLVRKQEQWKRPNWYSNPAERHVIIWDAFGFCSFFLLLVSVSCRSIFLQCYRFIYEKVSFLELWTFMTRKMTYFSNQDRIMQIKKNFFLTCMPNIWNTKIIFLNELWSPHFFSFSLCL